MPTKERKQREARRDALQEIGYGIAEHTAMGAMVAIERDGEGWPRLARPLTGYNCSCGLPLTPMPQFLARHGCLPLWVCGACNLDTIIDLARKLDERVTASQSEGV